MLMGSRGRCSGVRVEPQACGQRRSICRVGWGVILLRGRTIARSLAEAETRVGVFDGHFLSSGCGAVTNQAAPPGELTARGRAGPITRQLSTRRHRPHDERRDQRQPKRIGFAERRSPRHAGFSVPVSAVRVAAMHEAERSVERRNLLKLITASECRPRRVRSQCG
jgi:hypothetical protein